MAHTIIIPNGITPTRIGILQSKDKSIFFPTCPRRGCEGLLLYRNSETSAMICSDQWEDVRSCRTKFPHGPSALLPESEMRHGNPKASQVWDGRVRNIHSPEFLHWILFWTGLDSFNTELTIEER